MSHSCLPGPEQEVSASVRCIRSNKKQVAVKVEKEDGGSVSFSPLKFTLPLVSHAGESSAGDARSMLSFENTEKPVAVHTARRPPDPNIARTPKLKICQGVRGQGAWEV